MKQLVKRNATKIMLAVFTAGLMSSAMADDSRRLKRMIERKVDRLSALVQRGELQSLNRAELADLNALVSDSIHLIRNGGAMPTPTPVPPVPTPLPPRGSLTVEGYLENMAFSFSGRNTGQIFNQCVNELERNRNIKADDLYISVNGGSITHKKNSSSWWTTADQVCNIIEREAQINGNQRPHLGYTVIEAKVENQPLHLSGRTPMEIFSQCVDQVPANAKVDDIYVSVNGSRREHLRNSSSWWQGNKTICTKIVEKM